MRPVPWSRAKLAWSSTMPNGRVPAWLTCTGCACAVMLASQSRAGTGRFGSLVSTWRSTPSRSDFCCLPTCSPWRPIGADELTGVLTGRPIPDACQRLLMAVTTHSLPAQKADTQWVSAGRERPLTGSATDSRSRPRTDIHDWLQSSAPIQPGSEEPQWFQGRGAVSNPGLPDGTAGGI